MNQIYKWIKSTSDLHLQVTHTSEFDRNNRQGFLCKHLWVTQTCDWLTHTSDSQIRVINTYKRLTNTSDSHLRVTHTYEWLITMSDSYLGVNHIKEWITPTSDSLQWVNLMYKWLKSTSGSHSQVTHTYKFDHNSRPGFRWKMQMCKVLQLMQAMIMKKKKKNNHIIKAIKVLHKFYGATLLNAWKNNKDIFLIKKLNIQI